MKISAIPTIGAVRRLVRRRASDSCSVASVDAEGRALRRQRARDRRTFGRRQRSCGGDLLELDETQIVGGRAQRLDETPARRTDLAHPTPELDEQPPVTGPRGLFERAFVPAVAGEQHRDDIEIRRELETQIGLRRRGPARRRALSTASGPATRPTSASANRYEHAQRHDARGLERAEDEDWSERPHDGRNCERTDV